MRHEQTFSKHGLELWKPLKKVLAIFICLAPIASCRLSNVEDDFYDDRDDSFVIEADCLLAKSELLKPLALELTNESAARPTPEVVAEMDEIERRFEDCAD